MTGARFPLPLRNALAELTIAALDDAGAAAALVWLGLDATLDAYTRGLVFARSWTVPRWIPLAAIPVGSFFLATEFLRSAVMAARSIKAKPEIPASVTEGSMV